MSMKIFFWSAQMMQTNTSLYLYRAHTRSFSWEIVLANDGDSAYAVALNKNTEIKQLTAVVAK